MYNHFVKEDKRKFDASQKFWHVRFGPGCPEEWINIMNIKFIKDWEKLYPEEVHLAYGQKKLTLETKDMYKFAFFRRILARVWNIDQSGPQLDTYSKGLKEDEPIDLSKYFELYAKQGKIN